MRWQTKGSETSQYLQEQKSIEIPLVVASERGTAQTSCMVKVSALVQEGLWDFQEWPKALHGVLQNQILAEEFEKTLQRR